MPIPKPKDGESKSDFMGRCMGAIGSEYKHDQAVAICMGQWGKPKSARHKHIALNATSDTIRTEKLDGKTYIVAPVIPLVEGVHNGEFISFEEMSVFPEMWDGRPLPIDHPMKDGEPATAGSPDVMESSVVGFLFNVQVRDDIRGIAGEIWIDIDKAEKVAGGTEAINRIQSGGHLEVSTAYYCFIDGNPGEWKNPRTNQIEKYSSSQVQVRPDHLALLPFDTGACSWKDGCGAPRINKQDNDHEVNLKNMSLDFSANVAATARRPTFDGTESTSWASVNKSFAAYAKAYLKSTGASGGAPGSVNDAPAGMKKWIAARTLLGEADAATNRDLIFFPVVNPGTGKLNEGALRAVLSGRGSQANIPASAVKSAQDMARKLLKSEFGADLTENSEQMTDMALKANGAQVGKTLSAAIDVYTQESGQNDMPHRLAVACGIEDSTMQEIIDGKLDFIPRQWLDIFAAVLDMDPHDLYMACSNDNMDARYASDTVQHKKNEEITDAAMTISQNSVESATEKSCSCQQQKSLKTKVLEILQSVGLAKSTSTNEEKPDMSQTQVDPKKAKIDALIASDKNQFTEIHREQLMALSETQIDLFALTAVEVKPEVKTQETVNAEVKPQQAQQAAEVKAVEVKVEKPSKADILAALGVDEDTFTAVKALQNEKKQTRANKIQAILAIPENKFAQNDLEAFSDAALDNTLNMLQPESPFRVAPGRRVQNEEIQAPPAILLAKPGVRGVDFAVQTAQNVRKGVVN